MHSNIDKLNDTETKANIDLYRSIMKIKEKKFILIV